MNNLKLVIVSFMLVYMAQDMSAQSKGVDVIQLENSDGPDAWKVFTEVPRKNGDFHVLGVKVPSMELYFPSEKVENMTCILICPGGGYRISSFTKEGRKVAQKLNEIGIVAAVLRYRLPSEITNKKAPWIPLQDAQLAIQYLKQHAAELNLNPNSVGVMGFSAGGHLAASVSNLFMYPQREDLKTELIRPDFSVLIYPVITMDQSFTHMGSRKNLLGDEPSPENVALFSIEKQVTKETPPAFLLHSKDDTTVPIKNSRTYRDACVVNEVSAVLYELNSGGHGFGLGTENSGEWFSFLADWLGTTVKNSGK